MSNILARASAVGTGLKQIGDAAKRAVIFNKMRQLLRRGSAPSPAVLYGKGQSPRS